MVTSVDDRIEPFLGRILDGAGAPIGTCFQLIPGVLATAWHVLDGLGAGDPASVVQVDPLQGGRRRAAQVAAIDRKHDLAVLTTTVPLAGSVAGVAATDEMQLRDEVAVTGVVAVDDVHDFQFLDAGGLWAGGSTRDGEVQLGRLTASALLPGMSGAPVLTPAGIVVGVVSARYNSADGWLRDSVWIARTENLTPLLDAVANLKASVPFGVAGSANNNALQWQRYTYLEGKNPVAWALLTATADLFRIGCKEPITRELLMHAIPAYLSPDQRVADDQRLRFAEDEASRPIAGRPMLTPIHDSWSLGPPERYVLDESFAELLRNERRRLEVPQVVWDVALKLATSEEDIRRLELRSHNQALEAVSKTLRERLSALDAKPTRSAIAQLDLIVEPLKSPETPKVFDSGSGVLDVLETLGQLFLESGWVDRPKRLDLRQANQELVRELASTTDMAMLRRYALGQQHARRIRRDAGIRLIAELERIGDAVSVDELRQIAISGSSFVRKLAVVALTGLVVKCGDVTEVVALRNLVEPSLLFSKYSREVEFYVNCQVTDFLADRADEDSLQQLDVTNGRGRRYAIQRLVDLLLESAKVDDETLNKLKRLSDSGDEYAGKRLIDILFERAIGQDGSAVEDLRAIAGSRPGWRQFHIQRYGQRRFLDVLYGLAVERQGDALDQLRDSADRGDGYASSLLAKALELWPDRREAVRLLRAEVFSGNSRDAADGLLRLLSEGSTDLLNAGLTSGGTLPPNLQEVSGVSRPGVPRQTP